MAERKKLFNFIPQVELSMVREVKISGQKYNSSEEVAKSEFASNLLKSDREKFICLHLNVKNQTSFRSSFDRKFNEFNRSSEGSI